MQLVGATRAFIRRPFIKKSILHGILAAFIAIFLILGSLYLLQKDFPELIKIQDIQVLAMLFGGVILLGILFNLISTFFAVNKYLRMEEGDLYY
jgi:cell division transport system permease protein